MLLALHQRVAEKDDAVAVLQLERRGGTVSGMVVGGLTRADAARLSAYEGPNYRVSMLPVRLQGRLERVAVFEPNGPGLAPSADAWDLRRWQSRHKRPFVAYIRKALSAR